MFKIIPYVLAYIAKENQVLLTYRAHTSVLNNHYALPGGKIDADESPPEALKRELFEELGIVVKELHFRQVLYFQGVSETCVALTFVITKWEGTPINKEPEKHDHIKWVKKLPATILPRHRKIIEALQGEVFYSDDGFTN